MSWTNVSENEDENYITVFSTVISIYPLWTRWIIFSDFYRKPLAIRFRLYHRFSFVDDCLFLLAILCHSPISDTDFPLWYLQTFLRSTDLLQQVQDNSTFFSFAHFTIFLFFTNSWLLSTSLWLNLWAFYFLPNTELF